MKLLVVVFIFASHALGNIQGKWEGHCQKVEGERSTLRATMIYHFKNNREVQTFRQYYKDEYCLPKARVSIKPITKGTYEVVKYRFFGMDRWMSIELKLRYGEKIEELKLQSPESMTHIEVGREIFKRIANAEVFGSYMLRYAIRHGDLAQAKKLLESGVDPNHMDIYGYTDLMEAVSGGHLEIIQPILKAGAYINAQSEFGGTALMRAPFVCQSKPEIAKKIIDVLLKSGADRTLITEQDETAFSRAKMCNCPSEILELLRISKSDLEQKKE